ncbi:MAG: hypothetical protein AB1847_07500 [bacterium]
MLQDSITNGSCLTGSHPEVEHESKTLIGNASLLSDRTPESSFARLHQPCAVSGTGASMSFPLDGRSDQDV